MGNANLEPQAATSRRRLPIFDIFSIFPTGNLHSELRASVLAPEFAPCVEVYRFLRAVRIKRLPGLHYRTAIYRQIDSIYEAALV